MLRATNFATEESYKKSKVVDQKEFLTAQDERVDDECAALDGKVFDLDETSNDPPIHPNCRCTWLPVLKD